MISPSFRSGGLSGPLPADGSCLVSARSKSLRSERLGTLRILRTGIAVIALLVAVLSAPSTLPAKESSGTVRGVAYDTATGTPLPQVQVEMTGEVTVAATTTIEGLPLGRYTVSCASASHHAVKVEELEVIAEETADASMGIPVRVNSTGASFVASNHVRPAERTVACADSRASSAGGPLRVFGRCLEGDRERCECGHVDGSWSRERSRPGSPPERSSLEGVRISGQRGFGTWCRGKH